MTIPIVEGEWWSKGYNVASALLALFFWPSYGTLKKVGHLNGEIAHFLGVVFGSVFGVLTYLTPELINHHTSFYLHCYLVDSS